MLLNLHLIKLQGWNKNVLFLICAKTLTKTFARIRNCRLLPKGLKRQKGLQVLKTWTSEMDLEIGKSKKYFLFHPHIKLLFRWCCYKTVDFATAASQNCVCITQGKCHKMIYFHNFSIIKDLKNISFNIFCHNLHNIGFLMKGKLVREKSVLWCSHCRIHRNVAAPFWSSYKCPFLTEISYIFMQKVLYLAARWAGWRKWRVGSAWPAAACHQRLQAHFPPVWQLTAAGCFS